MRIVYCGSFRLPLFDAAASRVINIARTLRLAGHDVFFISWGGRARKEDLCDDGLYRYDGFQYVVTDELDFKGSIYNKIKAKLRQGEKTKKLLNAYLGNYDVIITYNCSLVRWLLPFCRKHKIGLISDITEWYDYSELKFFERPGYFFDMHFVQKKIKNKIVISTYLNNYYKKSHNVIIPATCDAAEEKWNKHQEVSKSNNESGVTLIYAGNPARKDAVHLVIRAVERLVKEKESIHFMILGITRESYIEKYRDLLTNENLSSNIDFKGRVSQDVVPSYYADADFMVLLREQTRKSNAGFPTKFAESFVSGTPVIANLTSDLVQYLRDGETGFIVSSTKEDEIYDILKNKALKLRSEEMDAMKCAVRSESKRFDYHSYNEALQSFISMLR